MDAMDKIRDEMAGSGDPGVQVIGEAMTRLLQLQSELADKVLEEGKTLKGAFAKVRDWAKANAKGGFCYVPPAKAAEIVAEYWGVDTTAMMQAVCGAETQAHAQAVAEAAAETAGDALDLDALLGGL